MRRIGANYIITNAGQKLKNAYLELSEQGEIIRVVNTGGELKEVSGLEFYNGVLIPGFVNAHTHLELAYLKGQIPEHQGLPHFIETIRHLRFKTSPEERLVAIAEADKQMQKEGIVLVGDIANGSETISTKQNSPIHYHTFVETFGLEPSRAESMFGMAQSVFEDFTKANLTADIVPHATYSVSPKLLQMIVEHVEHHQGIVSIHNQETASENEMFRTKSGALVDGFIRQGMNLNAWKASGENALISVLKQLPKSRNINLVHNTFTDEEDIKQALDYSSSLYWTLCPMANWYIEKRLPNIPLLFNNCLNICIGTDSLASNHQLSILQEMKLIQKHYPQIPFEQLVLASSLTGAKMLGKAKQFGSFESGKHPGVLLIEHFDFKHFRLLPESRVKRLV